MRKRYWWLPTILIVIGFVFLLFVWLGFGLITMGMPMMMPMMMGSGNIPVFMWVIPIVFILLAVVIFVYWIMQRNKKVLHHCEHCGREVEPEWKLCPYCGHPRS